jgi:biotin operon repressor
MKKYLISDLSFNESPNEAPDNTIQLRPGEQKFLTILSDKQYHSEKEIRDKTGIIHPPSVLRDLRKKGYSIETNRRGGVFYRLEGYKNKEHINKIILPYIKEIISKRLCCLCGTSTNIEIDHKANRENNNDTVEDFQSLCKHCNNVKREKCNKCLKTNIRPQHPIIKGYLIGNSTWESCKGCFYRDIEESLKRSIEFK